jgi:hypothetical protein
VKPKSSKPLGRRAYGSIGHLPHSRLGPGDHRVPDGQADICTLRTRDKHDVVIVQEKLDGTNVAIAHLDGQIIPLVRAGYRAETSRFEQHQMFARWVMRDVSRWTWVPDGFRLCGEWLAQAHGTRYGLPRGPFIAFDLIEGERRATADQLRDVAPADVPLATTLHVGGALSIDAAMALIGPAGFDGALDPPEGCVYRVERKGVVEFLAKYVRPGKVDGSYLPELTGRGAVWNWRL